MKIYLIDDDDLSNFVSAKMIERSVMSGKVQQFTEAKVALERLREVIDNSLDDIPDIIFLDINMPIMDGWDFLKEYQKICDPGKKDILIFMLTSSMYAKDIEQSKLYPEVAGYISKPITIARLNELKSLHSMKI